jgi:uncharacterized membrane protein
VGVSFIHPWWWLLLPLLLLVTLYLRFPWLVMARRVGGSLWFLELRRLGIRVFILFLLVAVLAGFHLVSVIQRQAVVFALDASASVGAAKDQGERWIRKALEKKPAFDLAGVVAFGDRVLVEEPPVRTPGFFKSGADPGADTSKLGEALNLARALLPVDARKRVVLLSDGRATHGDTVTVARQLREQGIRVDVVPTGGRAGPFIRLESVKLPPRVRVGETSALEITAKADGESRATLFLERDGKLISSADVDLRSGENRFSLPAEAGNAGLHSYRAYLVAKDRQKDVFSANNEGGAVQEVSGPPQVLVIAPGAQEAAVLVRSLKAAGRVGIEVVTPEQAPAGLTSWARYQAVFLVNVPAYDLGEQTMAEIEAYVRDGGGGLVMIGGPDSFGPGGYTGTPVEKALPVKMDISGRGELPSLGLMLVVDKSGSMAGYAGEASKVDLAKEAAARSVSVLTDRDQVGVIAFDTSPWWVVPLVPVKDKDKIREEIGRIYAGGGTEIFPPLFAAYQALKEAPTQVKHIILLTDGISASGGPYQKLLENMRRDGITLTCVAVGQEADAGMLKSLSELGRGRFYAASDADSIPSIFTKETVMATRSFAVNERFVPQVASSSVLLQGINQAPALEGYVTTSPKDRAEMALVSHRGDPVLAAWQYGLGRAVAWTPDVAGRWSAFWMAGQVFPRLWGNILSWVLPAVNTSALQINTRIEENGDVQVTVDDPARWQEVVNYLLKVTGPAGQTSDVELAPAGPGRYTARLPAIKAGAYLINVVSPNGRGQALVAQSSLVIPYPAEYKETGVELTRLAEIARAGGGEILTSPEQAFAPNLAPVRASRDLSSLLLILAGVLWLLDIAGRRLHFGAEEREALRKAWSGIRERLALKRTRRVSEPSAPWADQTLVRVERLRAQKRGGGGVDRESMERERTTGLTGQETGGRTKGRPDIKQPVMQEKQDTRLKEDTAARLLASKRGRKR